VGGPPCTSKARVRVHVRVRAVPCDTSGDTAIDVGGAVFVKAVQSPPFASPNTTCVCVCVCVCAPLPCGLEHPSHSPLVARRN